MATRLYPKDLPRNLHKRYIGLNWGITSTIARYVWGASFIKSGKILDIACGYGGGSEILWRAAHETCTKMEAVRINTAYLKGVIKNSIRNLSSFRDFLRHPQFFRRPCYRLPGLKVYGVDISLSHLFFAKKYYPRHLYCCADGCRIPFKSSTFDAVVSFATLEYVPDPWSAMEEMKRILKIGGILLVHIPIADPDNPEKYNRQISPAEIVNLITTYYQNSVFFGMRQNGIIYWAGSENELLDRSFKTDYALAICRK